jgi:hypothetical protein
MMEDQIYEQGGYPALMQYRMSKMCSNVPLVSCCY